jgi:hypothetical protein
MSQQSLFEHYLNSLAPVVSEGIGTCTIALSKGVQSTLPKRVAKPLQISLVVVGGAVSIVAYMTLITPAISYRVCKQYARSLDAHSEEDT